MAEFSRYVGLDVHKETIAGAMAYVGLVACKYSSGGIDHPDEIAEIDANADAGV